MKYNIEIARKKLLEYGYYLDTDVYKSNNTKMPCHDKDGFKYLIKMDDYRIGRHPYKYVKSNPFTIENIQMVLDKETDGTKILDTEYINTKTKMRFMCSCGSIFEMCLSSFVSGKRYCNYCSKSKRYDNLTDYYGIVNDICIQKGYVLLTDDIPRSDSEFEYICKAHEEEGVQKSYPYRFINQNQGCKYCGIISRGIKHRVDIEDVKKLTESKGFDFAGYVYMRPRSNSSSKIQVKCICREHSDKGIQIIDYQNLKNNKSGCIYCRGFGRTLESFQKELDDKNREIEIIHFNSYSDLIVKCLKCGYIWDTNGASLSFGHGCPNCCKSKYEKIIEDILLKNSIMYFPQYKFNDCRDINPLPFDFYLPQNNAIIEVDGQGHYYPVNFRGMSDKDALDTYNATKKHDVIKNNYCNDNGYNLIRIPFYIIDNKEINLETYVLDKVI